MKYVMLVEKEKGKIVKNEQYELDEFIFKVFEGLSLKNVKKPWYINKSLFESIVIHIILKVQNALTQKLIDFINADNVGKKK